MSLKKKLDSCYKEGTKGERHKGLRKIDVAEENIREHIKKAIHNFSAIVSFKKNGFSDWSASASFYSLYHCLLALLAKEGWESRNQSCTFAYIEQMIDDGKLSLTKEELREIFDKDVGEDLAHSKRILDVRERMQYTVKTELEDSEFSDLKDRTKQLFDKLRKDIENSL